MKPGSLSFEAWFHRRECGYPRTVYRLNYLLMWYVGRYLVAMWISCGGDEAYALALITTVL